MPLDELIQAEHDMLNAKTECKKARADHYAGHILTAEYQAKHDLYVYKRAIYLNKRDLSGRHIPPEPQLPSMLKNLEDAKLERDDCREAMRNSKRDETLYHQVVASSKDANAVRQAKGALEELAQNMQPAIQTRLIRAEERVTNLERTVREERMRQGN